MHSQYSEPKSESSTVLVKVNVFFLIVILVLSFKVVGDCDFNSTQRGGNHNLGGGLVPPHAPFLDTPLDPCALRHVCETEFGLSPFFWDHKPLPPAVVYKSRTSEEIWLKRRVAITQTMTRGPAARPSMISKDYCELWIMQSSSSGVQE